MERKPTLPMTNRWRYWPMPCHLGQGQPFLSLALGIAAAFVREFEMFHKHF